MSTKHTPGPWRLKSYPGTLSPFEVHYAPHPVDGGDYAALCSLWSLADARLVAAAPELLEALQELLPAFESCISGGNGELEGDKGMIARARAAIAKATGQA